MGQKVHPIGFRLGVYIDSSSSWFARKEKDYGNMLFEDLNLRKYVDKNLANAEIAKVEIEKTAENAKVVLHSARPGVVIGKKGQEIDILRKKFSQILNRPNVEVTVQEVKKPELNAKLVADNIASELKNRVGFKKALKKAIDSARKAGAKGISICVAGRLDGAEIARDEWMKFGSVPRHTLRADIDYALSESLTTFGIIGVKVWICRGEFTER